MSTQNKLISINDFINDVSEYYRESHNSKRALELIINYNDFLNQPITEAMFINHGEKPLFEGFKKCSQKETVSNRYKKSFDNFGKDEFQITIFKVYRKKMTYVTSFHLKTINDLVGKIDEFNSDSIFSWCRL